MAASVAGREAAAPPDGGPAGPGFAQVWRFPVAGKRAVARRDKTLVIGGTKARGAG